MVSSLSWVREKLANRLLKAFGTPREIFASTSSQLARVTSIGRIRARKTELVLSTAYTTTGDKRAIQKRLTDGEGQEQSF